MWFRKIASALVADILTTLGCDGEEPVTAPNGSPTSLRLALTSHYDLGKPSAELLALCGVTTAHHVIDALAAAQISEVKSPITPAAFIAALRKIQARLLLHLLVPEGPTPAPCTRPSVWFATRKMLAREKACAPPSSPSARSPPAK